MDHKFWNMLQLLNYKGISEHYWILKHTCCLSDAVSQTCLPLHLLLDEWFTVIQGKKFIAHPSQNEIKND